MDAPPDDSSDSAGSVPELTAAIARGDEAAFTRFHRMYWKRTYAYLLVVTKGDEALAADLAQTTMVRAARHLCAMESGEAVWRWLRTVARNAFLDTCRAGRRRPQLVEWTDELAGPDDDAHPPNAPLLSALEAALQHLTLAERSLIEETYFNGRRQAELAGELGLSLKALESRLTRVRQKLRQFVLFSLRNE